MRFEGRGQYLWRSLLSHQCVPGVSCESMEGLLVRRSACFHSHRSPADSKNFHHIRCLRNPKRKIPFRGALDLTSPGSSFTCSIIRYSPCASIERFTRGIGFFTCHAATSTFLSKPSMSQPSSSYAEIPRPEDEAVDSLPSSSAGSSTSVSPSEEEAISDAEREWRESLQQLELLLTMVLVPYLGKYFGRKCAYWSEWSAWNSTHWMDY